MRTELRDAFDTAKDAQVDLLTFGTNVFTTNRFELPKELPQWMSFSKALLLVLGARISMPHGLLGHLYFRTAQAVSSSFQMGSTTARLIHLINSKSRSQPGSQLILTEKPTWSYLIPAMMGSALSRSSMKQMGCTSFARSRGSMTNPKSHQHQHQHHSLHLRLLLRLLLKSRSVPSGLFGLPLRYS